MDDLIYHVSNENNRESIRQHGLRANTEHKTQPKGVYAWNELQDADEAHDWFGKADVWGIRTTGRKRIYGDPNTQGVYTASDVSPKNLILIKHVGWDANTGHRAMHEGDDRNCMDCLRFAATGQPKHKSFIGSKDTPDPGGTYDSNGFCSAC
jgi:hypothetical protein